MSIIIEDGHCFHCGLPNQEGKKYPVIIQGETHFMCCPGCQAVSESIVNNGLENYYEFRTEPAVRGDSSLNETLTKLEVYDTAELQEDFVVSSANEKQIQLTVEGITCPACAWLIEKQLAKLLGLRQISVNVSARRAILTWDDKKIKLSTILSRLASIGYHALPFQPDEHEASFKRENKTYLKKLGLAGIMTMQVMMLTMGQYFDVFGNLDSETVAYFNAICLLLTTPVVLYSGSVFYLSAIKALQARSVNMDVPVTIAILATYSAGVLAVNNDSADVYFESICMFIFFLLIGRYLEHRSRHKASEISSNMLKLIPATALKWEDGEWHSVLAKQLVPGDRVLIKAGESVPIDGLVINGRSTIDESMLTGEFEPIIKENNDKVYAGTINKQSSIELRVSATLKYAMMNQIIRLQETALLKKPKIAVLADRFSRYFVTAVLAISALTYAFWSSQGSDHAFWITISVLVATCPCALGLATPSALTCAMAKLNKLGILLKRADALEQITLASDIVFDKTGTLTKGEFSLQNLEICSKAYSQDYLLGLTSFIEKRSEHPISQAFQFPYAKDDFRLEGFEVVIGKGLTAHVNGQNCIIGSRKFVLNAIGLDPEQDNSGANVLLAIDHQVVAKFWVSDTLADDSKALIKELSSFQLSILSGDEQANVENVGRVLGIDACYGAQSPEAKLQHIQSQQIKGKSLIMLGDGINDAPVLSASDISIAVGKASDLAKNAADVILLNPSLRSVIDLIQMAKRTKTKIQQNVAWSLGYNILVLPFAVMGLLSPWQAALGMSLSSLIVVYNSTRLMR